MGVNPDRKPGVEPLRRLGVTADPLPAAPAAKLMPDVLFCSPLDHISKAERGILTIGQPRISILPAQACALERSLQSPPGGRKQHGSWQSTSTGYKIHPICVGKWDATGQLRRWEDTLLATARLKPGRPRSIEGQPASITIILVGYRVKLD